MTNIHLNQSSIEVIKADITTLQVDVIVNAANSAIAGGGGVDGAIHSAGGPSILEACKLIIKNIGHLPTGEAVTTTAGNLPCKKVIHTVGPVYSSDKDNNEQLLINCYKNSLKEAEENQLHSIAFSNISTGIYGYPKKDAAEIAIRTVKEYLTSKTYSFRVIFVCFDQENYDLYYQFLNS